MTESILEVIGLTKCFGAVTASDGLTFSVKRGSIHALIGPNGAGKTTLVNALTGSVAPSRGDVRIGQRTVNRLGPARRTKMGLGRSFQTINVFSEMSVRENLELAAQARVFRLQPFWRPAQGLGALGELADKTLEMVGLTAHANRTADALSHGDQRALELGLTLIGEPDIVLLDEPLAGVGHDGIDRMNALIRTVAKGRTVVLVEHNMDVVMGLSDEVVVLAGGQVLATGTPDQIRANDTVRAAYLGGE